MLNRAFFSLQSPWIPTWVALGNLGLNAALDAAFYRVGIWGLPLSTSIVNIVGTFALLELLRRRIGHIELTVTGRSVGLVTIASLVLAGISYGVWAGLHAALGGSFVAALVALLAAIAAGLAAYLVVCRLLGVRELDTLLSLRRRRPT
jgi:peptidoglycan biosynthesis protein MviN/MurJ (putative lipid II flippase)